MERLHNWAIGAVGVMAAAILTSLVAVRWRAWVALLIAVAALLMLLAIRIRLWQVRPRLFVGEPLPETLAFTNPGCIPEQGRIIYLHAWNKPHRGVEAIESLWLTLRFTDESTGRILQNNVFARWSFLPYPESLGETRLAKTVRIPGDESAFSFDIASLFHDSDEMFALCDSCRFWGFRRFALGSGPVLIDIDAKGATAGPHIDQSFRWRLSLVESDLHLEPIGTDKPKPRRFRP